MDGHLNYDEQKNSSGGLSTIAWLATCGYLFFFDVNGGGLLSLVGLLFVVGGMFVAALAIGIGFYFLQRIIGKAFVATGATPKSAMTLWLKAVGMLLAVGQVAMTVWAAIWAFSLIFSGNA